MAVEEAVRTFRELLVPSLDVCVPVARVDDDLKDDKVGHYNPSNRRIAVEDGPHINETVYHELCHAVQNQNGISVRDEIWTLAPEPKGAVRHRWSPSGEAFAQACEEGPTDAFLLGDGCDDDPPGVATLLEARALFTGPDPSIDMDTQGSFTPTLILGTGATAFDLRQIPSGIRLTADGSHHFVDPWTGLSLPPESSTALEDPDVAAMREAGLWLWPIPAPNGDTVRRRVFLTIAESAWNGYLGRMAPGGCVRPEERVFVFDDTLWSAWIDEGRVVVGYWTLSDGAS